jgi:hypothetical protein
MVGIPVENSIPHGGCIFRFIERFVHVIPSLSGKIYSWSCNSVPFQPVTFEVIQLLCAHKSSLTGLLSFFRLQNNPKVHETIEDERLIFMSKLR